MKLAKWDMFAQNDYAKFFDPQWMFGFGDGFDIVIGNPPYIQLQKATGEKGLDKKGKPYDIKYGDLYEPYKYDVFTKTGDMYCLFYELGYNLVKPTGTVCYITSNKWMRAGYGEKLREFFHKKTNPQILIDFGGVQVFESATVDTNIILFSKEANAHKTRSVVVGKDNKIGVFNLSDFVRHNAATISFNSSESWVILSPIELSIKRKIESAGVPLKDWDINIYRGVLTGYNEAFIISTDKRNEILSRCQSEDERKRTEELIRPILRGRDIKRYGYDWANLWLINTHNGIKGKLDRIHIEDYPAVKAHLDLYWDKISTRADKGDTPYNLRNCAYLDDFNKTQIVWLELTDLPKFSLVKDMVSLNTVFFMTGKHLNHIIGFLNSTVITWYFHNCLGARSGAGTNRWLKYTVEQLPVPPVCERITNIIGDNNITTKFESDKINEACMNIFGLNDEEKSVVMSFVIH